MNPVEDLTLGELVIEIRRLEAECSGRRTALGWLKCARLERQLGDVDFELLLAAYEELDDEDAGEPASELPEHRVAA